MKKRIILLLILVLVLGLAAVEAEIAFLTHGDTRCKQVDPYKNKKIRGHPDYIPFGLFIEGSVTSHLITIGNTSNVSLKSETSYGNWQNSDRSMFSEKLYASLKLQSPDSSAIAGTYKGIELQLMCGTYGTAILTRDDLPGYKQQIPDRLDFETFAGASIGYKKFSQTIASLDLYTYGLEKHYSDWDWTISATLAPISLGNYIIHILGHEWPIDLYDLHAGLSVAVEPHREYALFFAKPSLVIETKYASVLFYGEISAGTAQQSLNCYFGINGNVKSSIIGDFFRLIRRSRYQRLPYFLSPGIV